MNRVSSKIFSAYRKAFRDADIYYAAKANGSFAILRMLEEKGAGADVFSYGELSYGASCRNPA